jgi:hypothetical protein
MSCRSRWRTRMSIVKKEDEDEMKAKNEEE